MWLDMQEGFEGDAALMAVGVISDLRRGMAALAVVATVVTGDIIDAVGHAQTRSRIKSGEV